MLMSAVGQIAELMIFSVQVIRVKYLFCFRNYNNLKCAAFLFSHYQNPELPWRPKTTKKYTKTTKEMIPGSRLPSKIRQNRAKEIRLSWQLAAKYEFLGSLATKETRTRSKSPKCQENIPTAKQTSFLGSRQPPRKIWIMQTHQKMAGPTFILEGWSKFSILSN